MPDPLHFCNTPCRDPNPWGGCFLVCLQGRSHCPGAPQAPWWDLGLCWRWVTRGKRAAVHIPSGNIHLRLSPSVSKEKSTTTDDIKTVQTSLFSLVKDFFCRSFSGEEMQSLLNYVAAAQDEQQVRRLATRVPPRHPEKAPQTCGAGPALGSGPASRWGEAAETPVGCVEDSVHPLPAGLRGAGGDPRPAEGLARPGAALRLPLRAGPRGGPLLAAGAEEVLG